MTDPIRLLIADDHPVFRDGLASLLDPLPEIDVVARAADGAEAVALAAEHRPDVIIMDVQMPHLNGIEATRAVVAARPEVGVLVLTMGEDDGVVLSALRAGARGYLRKGAEQDEIVRAISTVHAGGVVFGASLAAQDRRGRSHLPTDPSARSRSSARGRPRSSISSLPVATTARSRRSSTSHRRRSATTSPASCPSSRRPTVPT